MSENVVTKSDIAPVKVPKSFNDLKKEELVAAANHFGSDAEGNVDAIKADLLDSGVTFNQYLTVFHPTEKVVEDTKFEMPEPVNVDEWPDADEGVNEVTVITAEPTPKLAAAEKYLIRFIGENPYFEFGTYKFTTDKPYGIMSATDAQKALVEEPTKFRQAFPAELEEFYS